MQRISSNIIIEESKDGLKGYITLLKKIGQNDIDNQDFEPEDTNVDEIIAEIKEVFKIGLKENELKDILTQNLYNRKLCIAEGIVPIDGEDGYIEYNFKLEKKIKPKILDDGTVNYRELDMINNVQKGDILAELIPPKDGKSGYRVTGKPIPSRKGKMPILRYGKNVKLLENGTTLIADKDGLVELKDNKIMVLDVFEVDDVDNKVGNIYFNGTVSVNGNALNGFKIKANGDVRIKGVVEGAYIENSGDVIVKQGVQGYNRMTIKSKGNVTTKFIENAIINSYKSVTAEAIMHSCVYSKDNVMLIGRRGLIVGGTIRAGKEIHAKTIGSTMATKTILEVGVDPELKEKMDKFKSDIKVNEDSLDKVIKSLNLLDKLKKINKLDENKAKMYIKLVKTKDSLISQLSSLKKEYEIMQNEMATPLKGQIKVSDTLHPGVRITIGNSTMVVRDVLKRCTLFREEGEIKIGPY